MHVHIAKRQTDGWSVTLAALGAASTVYSTSPSLARPWTDCAEDVPRPSVQAPAWVRDPAKRPHEVPAWFGNPSLRSEDTSPTPPFPGSRKKGRDQGSSGGG